jgi:hypothetical protein
LTQTAISSFRFGQHLFNLLRSTQRLPQNDRERCMNAERHDPWQMQIAKIGSKLAKSFRGLKER